MATIISNLVIDFKIVGMVRYMGLLMSSFSNSQCVCTVEEVVIVTIFSLALKRYSLIQRILKCEFLPQL